MKALGNQASLALLLPEAVVGLTIFAVMAVGVFRASRSRALSTWVGSVGLGTAMLVAAWHAFADAGPVFAFHGNLVIDAAVSLFRLLFYGTAILTLWFSYASSELDSRDFADMTALLCASAMGMTFMAAASDLLMMYLAMEFVGILSYVLAGLKREDQRSSEAALKYAIYGAAASGVALFGMSYLYGIAGDTSLDFIRKVIEQQPGLSPVVLLALLMVLAGLAYKIAAVPFHMWCPDVYQGAPTPITAFFSVAPKAAGFALLMRFLWLLLSGLSAPLLEKGFLALTSLISIATMTLGNLAAFNQTSVKRLLAYSSIAHAGYLLMGIATLPALMAGQPDPTGFRAVFFYLVIYLFMNLGAFFVVSHVVSRLGSDDIAAFRALGQRAPVVAGFMAVFLFSLTGIPPTAGFIGKFFLFYALIKQGGAIFYLLAFVGVLNSFISLFYYARILKIMYLEPSEDKRAVPTGALATVVLVILGLPTVAFGVWFAPLIKAAERVFG